MPEPRAGRWALARTPALVEDAGGRRAVVAGALADRRTWQLAPAVVLVVAVIALGVSGLRGEAPVSAVATATPVVASPSQTPSLEPSTSGSPAPTSSPSAPPTPSPSITPAPTPTTAPSPSARTTYTVRSGDTMYAIAQKFSTTVTAIMRLNGIADPSKLHIGQVLLIP